MEANSQVGGWVWGRPLGRSNQKEEGKGGEWPWSNAAESEERGHLLPDVEAVVPQEWGVWFPRL